MKLLRRRSGLKEGIAPFPAQGDFCQSPKSIGYYSAYQTQLFRSLRKTRFCPPCGGSAHRGARDLTREGQCIGASSRALRRTAAPQHSALRTPHSTLHTQHSTLRTQKHHPLTTSSIAIRDSSRPRISPSGQELGPSLRAFSGSGWVSMKRPSIPTATAARANTGTNSR